MWALGQHSAEIVLAGIDSATGKKCAGSLRGEVLSCGQLRFRDPSGSRQLAHMSARLPPTESGWQMSLEIKELVAEREIERYQLHSSHLNEQMVHVLKTIGFDKRYQRGVGQYLYDEHDAKYLDLLSGWGVFAIGRNHPTVRQALKAVLDSELPNLVQMGVSVLSGVLAERLLEFVYFYPCSRDRRRRFVGVEVFCSRYHVARRSSRISKRTRAPYGFQSNLRRSNAEALPPQMAYRQ